MISLLRDFIFVVFLCCSCKWIKTSFTTESEALQAAVCVSVVIYDGLKATLNISNMSGVSSSCGAAASRSCDPRSPPSSS